MAPEDTMMYNGTKLGLVLEWKQPVLIGGGRMPLFSNSDSLRFSFFLFEKW